MCLFFEILNHLCVCYILCLFLFIVTKFFFLLLNISIMADTGLRQRKTHSAERYMDAIAEKAPSSIRQYIKVITPYVGICAGAISMSVPYFEAAYTFLVALWISLDPFKPQLLLPALVGLIMCFFGGYFVTLIAAAEAYRMCGYATTLQCLKDLYEDFEKVLLENRVDDGKEEAQHLTPTELAQRKTLLFLRSVEPSRLSHAVYGLNSGFFAVIATLKLTFAKAITLGNAIGKVVEAPIKRVAVPAFESCLPIEYQKWAEPTMEYLVRSTCISLAWMMQRVLSAVHSAIQGGHLFSRNILNYLRHFKYIEIKDEDTYIDEIAASILAAIGIWFQLSSGFVVSAFYYI